MLSLVTTGSKRLAASFFLSCLVSSSSIASAFGPATAFSPRSTTSLLRMTKQLPSQQQAVEHNFSSSASSKQPKKTDASLPTMIVFDLDDCLWSPEMYTLRDCPTIPEQGDLTPTGVADLNLRGCVGLKVPHGPTVRLFPGARQVLYELATNPKYAGIVLAAASSSEEPSFSYACLEAIEILPGLTLRQMFRYDQIGRTGQLTSNKMTHFRLLHKESKIPYNEMLFFDDCNWGDHCGVVTREFGVVSYRTPRGLQYSEFEEAMEKYAKEAAYRS